MTKDLLIFELIKAAVGGINRPQIFKVFKDKYKLSDEEIQQIEKLCSFNTKPQKIDYASFYNILITKTGKKVNYPFTQLYTKENFLSEKECLDLISIIDPNLKPSTVADPKGSGLVSNYRTSQTAALTFSRDPFFIGIDQRIAREMGLNPFLGESMQAQKYNPGQYYKEHWDFFLPKSKEYSAYCEWMGQRTWTAMIYLNDVHDGGETYFKHLKLRIKPRRGMLVAWNNLYKNGLPNLKTLHEALPPKTENKYVITKWFRSWALI